MQSHVSLRIESAKRKAENHFTKRAESDKRLSQEQNTSTAAGVAKIAKLRALRLARDTAEQDAVDRPTNKSGGVA